MIRPGLRRLPAMIAPSLRSSTHSTTAQTMLIEKRPVPCMPSGRSLIALGFQYDPGRKTATMTIKKSPPSLRIKNFSTFPIGQTTLLGLFMNHARVQL
jgi:hypothetical protein